MYRIREFATINDIPSLMEINREGTKSIYSEDSWIEWINNENFRFYIAEINDIIVGYCLWKEMEDKIIGWSLEVLSKYRLKGIGTRLIKYSIESLNNKTIIGNVRKSNKTALAFYDTLDITISGVSEGYYRNGEDAICILFRSNYNSISEI